MERKSTEVKLLSALWIKRPRGSFDMKHQTDHFNLIVYRTNLYKIFGQQYYVMLGEHFHFIVPSL